ncbi:MAG: glycosyltransferase family 1 protein [Planctomycetota bacterium]
MQRIPADPPRRSFRPHVAIDGLCLSERRGGIGAYTLHLAKALLARGDVRLTCFLPAESATAAGELLQHGATVVPVRWSLDRASEQVLWENWHLRRKVRRLRADLYFGPNFALPPRLGLPSIVTLHDFAVDHFPHTKSRQFRVYLGHMIRRAVRRADMLLTDSQAVADDLITRYEPGVERVRVAPLAPVSSLVRQSDEVIREHAQRFEIEDGYILHASNFDDRKNVEALAIAFDQVCRRHDRPDRLVLAGGHPWTGNIGKRLRARGLSDRVRFTGYVPTDTLAALYSGATFFAFPSLYEGFGLPLLEAMRCETPVLTSRGGALAEVAGDAARLVDPTASAALEEGIEELLLDPELRTTLVERGRRRMQEFSWERCAEETFSAMELVLRSRGRWPVTIGVPELPRSVRTDRRQPTSTSPR